jgi:hypothetical protein
MIIVIIFLVLGWYDQVVEWSEQRKCYNISFQTRKEISSQPNPSSLLIHHLTTKVTCVNNKC